MERYNPFASTGSEPTGADFTMPDSEIVQRPLEPSTADRTALGLAPSPTRAPNLSALGLKGSRYTTSFPDPFEPPFEEPISNQTSHQQTDANHSPRSNSVTFAPRGPTARAVEPGRESHNVMKGARPSVGGSGPLSSLLSRATSVTSGTMSVRVNEAMRNAVDSLQSVPSNLNMRLSSATTQIVGGASSAGSLGASAGGGAFTSSSQATTVINRLKVILVIDDNSAGVDWAALFSGQASGSMATVGGSTQAALTSLFTSAAAQLSSSPVNLGGSNQSGGRSSLLVEQADMLDISLLANQSTATATVLVSILAPPSSPAHQAASRTSSGGKAADSRPLNQGTRIVRPEFVVVRQRASSGQPSDHLRAIVTALDYCMVPMLEPYHIWNVFQDRQAVFSRLLRVQKALGKENFPLIPQVYCQTKRDLLNYINSRTIPIPCLLKTGQLGEGKMHADDLQILRGIVNFVSSNKLDCTVEPFLDVKYDLIVQKIGKSLKILRRSPKGDLKLRGAQSSLVMQQEDYQPPRQPAARQTSLSNLGASLSSLIPGSTVSGSQQYNQNQANLADRRQSQGSFECLPEVSSRYKSWMQAISREFDHQLEAFRLKIVVTRGDREYIVGLSDCSMSFLGPSESREEDMRNFVELINGHLSENDVSGDQTTSQMMDTPNRNNIDGSRFDFRRCSSDDKALHATMNRAPVANESSKMASDENKLPDCYAHDQVNFDKKRIADPSQIKASADGNSYHHNVSSNVKRINCGNCASSGNINQNGATIESRTTGSRPYGQLSSRSQSVSVNQSDYLDDQMVMHKASFFTKQQSERSDSMTNDEVTSRTDELLSLPGSQQLIGGSASDEQFDSGQKRESSFRRTFFDQTSTAFSSIHKQSITLLRKFDSRANHDIISSTPPLSAKSDRNFRPFGNNELMQKSSLGPSVSNCSDEPVSNKTGAQQGTMTSRSRDRIKAQSVDGAMVATSVAGSSAGSRGLRRRETPPKPPPPPMMSPGHVYGARQSSLTSQSVSFGSRSQTTTPTRNRAATEVAAPELQKGSGPRPPMTRQGSALSTLESYDPGTTSSTPRQDLSRVSDQVSSQATSKRGSNFDSASITSGDSTTTTSENTAAEDTMNNLKKTFASIFGDQAG